MTNKIREISLKGLTQICSAVAAKLYIGCECVLECKNGTDLVCHHAEFLGLGLRALLGGAKKVRCFCFLSVRLLNDKTCKHDIIADMAIEPFERS